MNPTRRIRPLLLAVVVAASACGAREEGADAASGDGLPSVADVPQAGDTTPPQETVARSGSGIEGRAVLGPECARIRVGEECPDRPYRTSLLIRSLASGELMVRAECDEEGYFHVELEPGDYMIEPSPTQALTSPTAEPLKVTVKEGEYSEVVMRYDSGKR